MPAQNPQEKPCGSLQEKLSWREEQLYTSLGIRHRIDSSLLLPLVGFLPVGDPHIASTIKAVEKHLLRDGLLLRYDTKKVGDGLPPEGGAFPACNFWLVDVYVLQGRMEEATRLLEKLLAIKAFILSLGIAALLSPEHHLEAPGELRLCFSSPGELLGAVLALTEQYARDPQAFLDALGSTPAADEP